MSRINPPAFINPAGTDDEVIVFGKGDALHQSDWRDGVSRIGGQWRQPSYQKAYLRAARVLLKEAISANDLDQLGLPIFYLLRHSTELLLKNWLGMLYEIADMQRTGRSNALAQNAFPSKAARERLQMSHNLISLSQDFKSAVEKLGFGEFFPDTLLAFVTKLGAYETNPTWSRYAKSPHSKDYSHLKEEVTIPLVELHRQLEGLVQSIDADPSQESITLGGEIYLRWNHLMQINDGP